MLLETKDARGSSSSAVAPAMTSAVHADAVDALLLEELARVQSSRRLVAKVGSIRPRLS